MWPKLGKLWYVQVTIMNYYMIRYETQLHMLCNRCAICVSCQDSGVARMVQRVAVASGDALEGCNNLSSTKVAKIEKTMVYTNNNNELL